MLKRGLCHLHPACAPNGRMGNISVAADLVGSVHDHHAGLFPKDAGHFAVVSRKGFHETTDGGKSWRSIAPYPPSLKGEFNTHGWMMNFAWDPLGKGCYVARMGQPTCKCEY